MDWAKMVQANKKRTKEWKKLDIWPKEENEKMSALQVAKRDAGKTVKEDNPLSQESEVKLNELKAPSEATAATSFNTIDTEECDPAIIDACHEAAANTGRISIEEAQKARRRRQHRSSRKK